MKNKWLLFYTLIIYFIFKREIKSKNKKRRVPATAHAGVEADLQLGDVEEGLVGRPRVAGQGVARPWELPRLPYPLRVVGLQRSLVHPARRGRRRSRCRCFRCSHLELVSWWQMEEELAE